MSAEAPVLLGAPEPRYRNMTAEEVAHFEANGEPWHDAFVDTLKGLVLFAEFTDDAAHPLGYRTNRWTSPLPGGAK